MKDPELWTLLDAVKAQKGVVENYRAIVKAEEDELWRAQQAVNAYYKKRAKELEAKRKARASKSA